MEFPHLVELFKKHSAQGLQMVAIGADKPESLRQFREEYGAPFPILHDPEFEAIGEYGVQGIPRTFLLNSRGEQVGDVEGYGEEIFAQKIVKPVEQMLSRS